MGETTLAIAKAHPEIEFVAVEVHGPGVGSLLNRIDRERLTNLRVVRHDAVEVLERMVAPIPGRRSATTSGGWCSPPSLP